ncbi:MAG: Wadjet anti-phage system protein JetA family protein [Acholeplasmataceae bacterium]
MAQLFERLPINFFSVLASPNKETYIDCIMVIYHAVDSIEDAFQGDREYIVQKLIDYFDDKADELFEDVEDGETQHTSRQKAVHVINVLKKTGWLGEEELGDYKTSLNLFDYSIQLIDTLIRIQNNTQNEYTGEIYAVYSLLSSFSIEEGIGVLEQAALKTDDIIRKLKALKANIYRFYYDITKKRTKDDLHELLEKLLIEYKQNFFDSAYYNLKTTDSLSRYKRGILENVSQIIHNEHLMDELCKNVMYRKRMDDYNEAFNYVEDKLRYISDSFNALEYLILSIDKKNEQYVTAAASKILFLTNQSDDIEGIFNRLFQIVLKEKDFDYASLFNIVQMSNLDTNSLYNQRRMRIDTQIEEITFDDDFISDDVRQQKIKALLKNNIFGKKEIDQYVKILLENHHSIEAKDVLIETQEDYVKLILIFLYSKSVGMHYDVILTGDKCKNNFITFQNFIIKGKAYE